MPESFKHVADKLNTSRGVLIVLPKTISPDSASAGLALLGYLTKLGKEVTIVSTGGILDHSLDFLQGFDRIVHELAVSKTFQINVSTVKTQLDELSYNKNGNSISILLKPKTGEFHPEDISFKEGGLPYDAVVVLGASSFDDLGEFYGKNTNLFFELPVINIDFKGANKNYGQFNLVELNASSVSEVVFDLLIEMGQDFIDANIATALLAGIIYETNSFQNSKTTPHAFIKSSRLVGLGGDQQEIINRVYKNKSMAFLRLWGSVLSRLVHEPENNLAFSSASTLELAKVGASIADASAVHPEMRQQLGFAKVHIFFMESDSVDGGKQTRVHASGPQSLALGQLLSRFEPELSWPQTVKFTIPTSLIEAQQQVLEIIRPESQKLS